MKKILVLFSIVLLASSCIKQMEEPESAKIAGIWAVVDSDDFTSTYYEFEHGQVKKYVSWTETFYVSDQTIWGYLDNYVKNVSTERYSLIDGTLYFGSNNWNVRVDGETMTLGDNKCRLVENFRSEYYSTINLPDPLVSFAFNGGNVEWSYTINNPVESFALKVNTPDWVKNVRVLEEKICFTVSETSATRTGEITISYPSAEDVSLNITQNAAEINLEKASVTLDYTASSSSFTYSIPNPQPGYALSVETDADWIINVKDNGSSISFSVAENNSGSSRTGNITLVYGGVSKVFTVTQTYSASSISLTPTSGSHDYTGGTYTFKYTISNPREGQKATFTSSDSWITSITDDNGTVSYKVSRNTTGSSRSGKITVKYGDQSNVFTITQSAASLTLSSSSETCTYASVSKSFSITIPNRQSDLAVSVKSNVTWITGVSESSGTVSYAVAENNSGSSRTGKITVTYAGVSKEFTVTQSYSATSLSLSPTSASHDYTSNTYTFKYTISNPREGQKATVSTTDSWITGVTDNNGTVSYTVAENNSGSSRTGTITVAYAGVSKDFTVSQSYSAVSLSLSPTSASHDYTSGTYTFNYTVSNPREGQKATVSTSDSWITGVSESNGTVSYAVAENNSGLSRTGKITVSYAGVSIAFTVTQTYSASSISFTPTSADHDYTCATYTFKYAISNPREGQEATASTSDTWISGVILNDGTVSYTVSENKSGSSRTGKITVTYAGVSKVFLVVQMDKPEDLSVNGTANSYIVSNAGSYCFKSVKGNSSTSVGTVSSVEVLWESFGTSTTPSVGDLIKSVSYKNGDIYFNTATTFKEGNAVIAAKNSSGTILWSWHIWFTDQPEEQVYYNNAGTMMDRNLGATSATPGDVGALGLLYQWGRKDPFLGSSSISSSSPAKSTTTWPSAVSTSSSTGTVSYVTEHPTTFVYASSSPYDWHYLYRYNSLWPTSSSSKSIYDPCPVGWRVPDGGDNGVWSKALGSSSGFTDTSLYNSSKEGMNLSGKFGSASIIWYPASGSRGSSLSGAGDFGRYWSASPNWEKSYYLRLSYNGSVALTYANDRALGQSVRCIRE